MGATLGWGAKMDWSEEERKGGLGRKLSAPPLYPPPEEGWDCIRIAGGWQKDSRRIEIGRQKNSKRTNRLERNIFQRIIKFLCMRHNDLEIIALIDEENFIFY